MSTKQRKIDLATREASKRTELATARQASIGLRNPLVAWVYLASVAGCKLAYMTRFSATPERSLPGEPGSSLRPVAGFKNGVCVQSFADDVPAEVPKASVRVSTPAPVQASNGKGWKYQSFKFGKAEQ